MRNRVEIERNREEESRTNVKSSRNEVDTVKSSRNDEKTVEKLSGNRVGNRKGEWKP